MEATCGEATTAATPRLQSGYSAKTGARLRYLEDTSVETGCLRVVPGSHATYGDGAEREARYANGQGDHAHGEWLALDPSETPIDVPVPAGTPVFFDGRLVHSARHNEHPTRSSYARGAEGKRRAAGRCAPASPRPVATAASPRRYRIIAHYVQSDLKMSWRGVDFSRGRYADRYEVRAPLRNDL